jgi:carboxyl-terminal processing protease
LVQLHQSNKPSAIVLDLRFNPGGLLNEAVNISNLFVERGQEIVSTRGKIRSLDKSYLAINNPVDVSSPLVVLVNSNSASASEIVSGSLQDLDRAVIIGQRTFGKGLVQTTRTLGYNAQLKITSAKYYIPSGRCIQAVDYTHRNEDGSVGKIPDSLVSEFHTKAGRKVYDGGGVLPDVTTEPRKLSNISVSLAFEKPGL